MVENTFQHGGGVPFSGEKWGFVQQISGRVQHTNRFLTGAEKSVKIMKIDRFRAETDGWSEHGTRFPGKTDPIFGVP